MIRRSEMLMLAGVLMIITIVGVAAFQGYWIRKLYAEEWNSLKKETDIAFRDVIYDLQIQRFRKNNVLFDKGHPVQQGGAPSLFMFNVLDSVKTVLMDTAKTLMKEHGGRQINITLRTDIRHDSISPEEMFDRMAHGVGEDVPMFIRYLSSGDSTAAPLSADQVDSAYKKALLKAGITVPFRLERIAGKEADLAKTIPQHELKTGIVFIGLANAYGFQASFANPFSYILRKLRLPIVVGFLLLALTTLSLIFLYRNLVQQRQISAIKNEFISNMTHELKTPISTVTVAVEALRHFGALEDPEKTREYLDISALELQRLSLLVDKVLKLSLFENKQIDLKPERIDLPALTAEVMASMKLSFEKAGAVVQLKCEGEAPFVRADRMHLGSVISNLLDNALKYSRESPVVAIGVSREGDVVRLSVADNGIGIPAAYREKIFEKFFRVPSGDHHNIKGYGLGLSYVHHIVTRHEGKIAVESREGKGSTFTIQLPAA
ncbi:MAG TPA: HAMP domain-containing sensor histidine kinase [Puia sp.]|nr:HAMP domain-containing sensor histidine kinase [Puia sp.]